MISFLGCDRIERRSSDRSIRSAPRLNWSRAVAKRLLPESDIVDPSGRTGIVIDPPVTVDASG